MTDPLDPRLRNALAGAAERGTPRSPDDLVAAARAESARPEQPVPIDLTAERPARRPLILTLASAAAVIAVLAGVVAIAGRNRGPGVGPDGSGDLLGYLRDSTNGTLSSPFRARLDFEVTGLDASAQLCSSRKPASSATLHLAVDPDAHLVETLDAPDGRVVVINTGRSMYFAAEELPDGVASPRPWVRGDFHTDTHQEVLFSIVAGKITANSIDPREGLEKLRNAATSVTDLGTTEIDGVPVRRLRMTTDPVKLVETVREQQQRRYPGTTLPNWTAPASNLPETVFETWIGEDGILRRLDTEERMKQSVPGASEPTEVRGISRLHLFDHGKPVPVPVPGDNQMVAADELPATTLAPSRAAGFCPLAVPDDVAPAVADAMRRYDACIAERVHTDLAGRLVKDVAGGSQLSPESVHGPACRPAELAAWCAANPRIPQDSEHGARFQRWCAGASSSAGLPVYVPDDDAAAPWLAPILTTPPPEKLTDEQRRALARGLGSPRTVDDARRLVERLGWELRVTDLDSGFPDAQTDDRRPNRLNVGERGGFIVEVYRNG